MDAIAWFATHFIGLFNEAAKSLLGLITGILPLLLVLLTAMYAVTTWIGEDRVTKAVQWAGKYAVDPVHGHADYRGDHVDESDGVHVWSVLAGEVQAGVL